jgi:hypothetical protein
VGEDRNMTGDAHEDSGREELITEFRDRVRFLREELARKDAILLRMAESIPQLEAREPPESPAPTQQTATSAGGGPREEGSERPWWHRLFGG